MMVLRKIYYWCFSFSSFATGLPHYGHLLAGTIKDIVTRYAHQTGHHVERRFGWDCHGLPVEHEIDKKLKIKGSQDVLDMGIDVYNGECRKIVDRYTAEWEEVVTRLGRWIDFKNDYKTMDPNFMESVWWVFRQIYDKGLVYNGFRVMPYSTGCTTPLSNFEAGLNYKDTSDPSVYVTFPTVEDNNTILIAWTTTPWTLPSNIGLCVHPTLQYVKVLDHATQRHYILLETRLPALYPKMSKKKYKPEFDVLEKMKGQELKGIKYVPLFDYFVDKFGEKGFKVLVDEYVTDDSGTGIVHQAPAFGEEDYKVAIEAGVIEKGGFLPCPVDADGKFTEVVTDFVGQHVKEADLNIIAKLKENGRLIRKEQIIHSYPFCWRSETPLIYKAVPSWFVRVEDIKADLLKNNEKTYWVPSFVKEKRFHNWLENARDWNISRNRYWGTPIPIWMSEDGEEVVVIGSVAELESLSGVKVTDLHRESIDDITIPSKEGKGDLRRIPEVFDCWFESGSMPYAQQHYPFENKEEFEKGFPADFIAEGLDQTRGWFYTLMVLSTALFDKPAFKNLIVNGLVLAEDGKKMSKRLKNYPPPQKILNSYGADALRLYLINSPVVRAEPLRFQEIGVLGKVKDVFLPWFNALRFFVQNSERLEQNSGVIFDREKAVQLSESSTNLMDKWILAELHDLIDFVQQEMKAYRLYTVVPRLVSFIDQLTNWYVRLNRERLKNVDSDTNDCVGALSTLFVVLVDLSLLMAPFTPFFTEYVYQLLKVPKNTVDKGILNYSRDGSAVSGETEPLVQSVHFEMVPTARKDLMNADMMFKMKHMQDIINLSRLARGNDLPLKKPVRELILVHHDRKVLDCLGDVESYILSEVNAKKISKSDDEKKWCKLSAKADGRVLGQKLGKKFKSVFKAVQKLTHDDLVEFQKKGSIELEGEILTTEDVRLERTVIADENVFVYRVSDSNLCVILDTTQDVHSQREYISRDLVSKVQKLRKNSNVLISDELDVFLKVQSDKKDEINTALKENEDYILAKLKRKCKDMESLVESSKVVGTSEEEIDGIKLTISLVALT